MKYLLIIVNLLFLQIGFSQSYMTEEDRNEQQAILDAAHTIPDSLLLKEFTLEANIKAYELQGNPFCAEKEYSDSYGITNKSTILTKRFLFLNKDGYLQPYSVDTIENIETALGDIIILILFFCLFSFWLLCHRKNMDRVMLIGTVVFIISFLSLFKLSSLMFYEALFMVILCVVTGIVIMALELEYDITTWMEKYFVYVFLVATLITGILVGLYFETAFLVIHTAAGIALGTATYFLIKRKKAPVTPIMHTSFE